MAGRFEEGMQKLSEIRARMEQEQTDLEAMVQLYKEGLALSKSLTEQLDLTEKEILTLEKESNDGNAE
ncbi:MAG: exodeoxyribonuclease VII small subunit [Clostridiales bacterium]|nr:exodeoxyribonuclease VII small subunit [Clostridiales bacterium]